MGSIEEEEQILKHGPILLIWSDTYESNGLYRSKVVQLERLGGRRTDIKTQSVISHTARSMQMAFVEMGCTVPTFNLKKRKDERTDINSSPCITYVG